MREKIIQKLSQNGCTNIISLNLNIGSDFFFHLALHRMIESC